MKTTPLTKADFYVKTGLLIYDTPTLNKYLVRAGDSEVLILDFSALMPDKTYNIELFYELDGLDTCVAQYLDKSEKITGNGAIRFSCRKTTARVVFRRLKSDITLSANITLTDTSSFDPLIVGSFMGLEVSEGKEEGTKEYFILGESRLGVTPFVKESTISATKWRNIIARGTTIQASAHLKPEIDFLTPDVGSLSARFFNGNDITKANLSIGQPIRLVDYENRRVIWSGIITDLVQKNTYNGYEVTLNAVDYLQELFDTKNKYGAVMLADLAFTVSNDIDRWYGNEQFCFDDRDLNTDNGNRNVMIGDYKEESEYSIAEIIDLACKTTGGAWFYETGARFGYITRGYKAKINTSVTAIKIPYYDYSDRLDTTAVYGSVKVTYKRNEWVEDKIETKETTDIYPAYPKLNKSILELDLTKSDVKKTLLDKRFASLPDFYSKQRLQEIKIKIKNARDRNDIIRLILSQPLTLTTPKGKTTINTYLTGISYEITPNKFLVTINLA